MAFMAVNSGVVQCSLPSVSITVSRRSIFPSSRSCYLTYRLGKHRPSRGAYGLRVIFKRRNSRGLSFKETLAVVKPEKSGTP